MIKETCDFPEGSGGHAMWVGERRGRNDWLAGITENPFTAYEDTLEAFGWAIGQAFCEAELEKVNAPKIVRE